MLADHVDAVRARDPGIDHHALAGGEARAADDDSRAVRAEDARLRHRRKTLAHPQVEPVERGGSELDQHIVGPRSRIGRVLVAQHLGPAVLVNADRLHGSIVRRPERARGRMRA